MNADSLIFDLDGTLWDTCDICAVGWNNVIDRNGIAFREIVGDDVRRVAGRPHAECIRSVFGSLTEAEIGIVSRETMEEDNRLIAEGGGTFYPDLQREISRLAGSFKLGIVSNCQEGYIETFLEQSKLTSCFIDFECWGNTGKSKANNLESLIERNGLERPVFIGDTTGDQAAAQDNEVPFVFARYGFGTPIGADAEIDRLIDLEQAVRSL
jgi:phosphoglycolate phosphatase